MPSRLWNRMRNVALLATSAGCVVLLVLLLGNNQKPPAAPVKEAGKRLEVAPRNKTAASRKKNKKPVVAATLDERLHRIRQEAKRHKNKDIVSREIAQLLAAHQKNVFDLVKIRIREAEIHRDILDDWQGAAGPLEEARKILDSIEAERVILRMTVLVQLGDAYSRALSEKTHTYYRKIDAAKAYTEALDLPWFGPPYDRNIDTYRPLYSRAADGALSTLPREKWVTLDLHPIVWAEIVRDSPSLKPFLHPMSRTVTQYYANIRTWLTNKIKAHQNDKEMQAHLKAVLALLLKEKIP